MNAVNTAGGMAAMWLRSAPETEAYRFVFRTDIQGCYRHIRIAQLNDSPDVSGFEQHPDKNFTGRIA
ncbi:hypothetical protein DOV67_25045 [Salmonella enterica subsp. enterica serovar Java]|uniref:Uncharacterized protein n=3 Tax=Salmonella enterica TaxID=28901 RepID=A0A3Y9C6R3_SALEB|nr:hypothetical protein [Salmonella enterica subsp. enterica serovar Java]EAO1478093.1 hypothetical protein [Salmonella enterica]HBM0100009.1 hypothetical protein [Salmonella enterica subsp. enterica serovar Wedding]EAB8479636.1 hypothetical protein [Salmonella enterica subsp. enterica serovar Java]EBR8574760.1 hypothetical protein [Salmonella enterica subsp. enterica serovar Java]